MKLYIKLLRTIIGLPFVILAWPLAVFLVGGNLIFCWIFEGKTYWFYDAFMDVSLLPIKWLREVWENE